MVWVGGDGMSFVRECVVRCIGAYPTSPSSPPTHRGPALLCLCQRGWCSTPEVCQIANGFFLYFAILMGVRVHSSCFAYSEAPNCSLPGALELHSSLKFP